MRNVACAVVFLALLTHLAAEDLNPKAHLSEVAFAFVCDPTYTVEGESGVRSNDAKAEYRLEGQFDIERPGKKKIDRKRLVQSINTDLSRLLQKKVQLTEPELAHYTTDVQVGEYSVWSWVRLTWRDDTHAQIWYGTFVTPKGRKPTPWPPPG